MSINGAGWARFLCSCWVDGTVSSNTQRFVSFTYMSILWASNDGYLMCGLRCRPIMLWVGIIRDWARILRWCPDAHRERFACARYQRIRLVFCWDSPRNDGQLLDFFVDDLESMELSVGCRIAEIPEIHHIWIVPISSPSCRDLQNVCTHHPLHMQQCFPMVR